MGNAVHAKTRGRTHLLAEMPESDSVDADACSPMRTASSPAQEEAIAGLGELVAREASSKQAAREMVANASILRGKSAFWQVRSRGLPTIRVAKINLWGKTLEPRSRGESPQ